MLGPARRPRSGPGLRKPHELSAPGEILLYPGGISETEILFPYGSTRFASKVGQLAGNHFLTIIEGQQSFKELGRLVVWEGAQTSPSSRCLDALDARLLDSADLS